MGRDVNRTEPENILVTSAQKIKVAGTVTAVPGYFTKNNKALTEVLVQGNMTKISYQAFYNCENLTSATLDAPIDTIRYEAFYGCKALPGIEMPESMKCIEKAAFYNCSALSSFTIPAATEYVGRGIFTNCTALKSITIEDSDKPLYFQNDYNTYYNGNVELCTSDMESLYLGRDITRADASRLVSKVQKITLGTPVTDIGNMFSSTTNVTKVSVPWQTPIEIADAAFATATYDNAILSVPGGTEATYRSLTGWKKFKSIQPGSYFVTATATAGGKLKFANLTVSDGTKKMLIDRETDVTFEVMPDENYDFTSLTVNGEAVPVTNGTYTYTNLLSDINVEAKFTEKPKFDITATAIGGTVSLNGAAPSASQSIKVYRDTGVVLTIAASEGYRLKTLTVNGADMTAQVSNNTLQLENIQEAQDIVVTFEQYIFSVSITGAGISVSTMTPQYGESVTVTIEDDPDRTLVALLVNGQDVTAQVANGQYVIKNVTGNVTIEVTFRSTKEFITLTGELATYSCAQDLNFTGSDLKAYIAAGYNKQENEVLLVRVYDVPAGTGIVVKGTKNTTYKVPYFTSQSYYVNLLRAQLTPGQITATTGNMSNFVLKEDDSDGKFYAPESPVLLAGNKAFLQVPTDFFAGARFVKIVFAEEEGTGIDRFEMIEKTSGDAIYNLSGQRVQQTGRGIYIENGRKVLKK